MPCGVLWCLDVPRGMLCMVFRCAMWGVVVCLVCHVGCCCVFRCAMWCGASQPAIVTYCWRKCDRSEPVSLGGDACGERPLYLWRRSH